MSRTFIRPYHKASKAVKLLKEELKIRSLRIDGESNYRPRDMDCIINYGNTDPFDPGPGYLLNYPQYVRRAVSKDLFFLVAKDNHLPTPEFRIITDDFDDEDSIIMLEETFQDRPIVARTMTRASQGRGAYYFENVGELPEDLIIDGRRIKLVTEYIKKYREFRVHVMARKVFDCVEKKRRKGAENVDWKIRNHKNGWVFCRNDLEAVPEQVMNIAVDAVAKFRLDFGAVDVIYNDYKNQAFVLEINTAPGLEETTLKKYAEAFKRNYLE